MGVIVDYIAETDYRLGRYRDDSTLKRKSNLFCNYSSRKMVDEQPAATPADGGANKKNGGNDDDKKPNRGRRYRGNQTNRKWKESRNAPTHVPKEKVEGRSKDLKGITYDVANTKGGVAYICTTEEITRYIGEKHTVTATYIRTAVLTLTVPAPPRPTPPVLHQLSTQLTKKYSRRRSACMSRPKPEYRRP